MTPNLARANESDRGSGNRKLFGDFFLKDAGHIEASYFKHLTIGKFRHWMCGPMMPLTSKSLVTMLLVGAVRDALQVFQSIVVLVAINVIDFGSRGHGTAKRDMNESVNGKLFPHAISTERDSHVSLRVQFKDTLKAIWPTVRPAPDSADRAEIANFVDAIISDNSLPYLAHNKDFSMVAA